MMYFTEFPIVQAIGWTLLHALWQGLLIAIVLRLLLLLIPNRKAVLRYGLSVGAIFLMLLWAAVTCWQHLPAEGSLILAEISPLAIDVIPDSNEVLYSTEEISAEISGFSLADVSNRLQPLLPYLVGIWLLGVLLWSLRFLGSMYYLYRLPRRHVWQPDAAWQRKLASLQKQLAISQRVRLLISAQIQEPLTMGFLKPVILIPASLLSNLPPEQIEAILLHELAHIRRADYLVNLLLSVVEILFFYHPAYWWISRQVKQEREHCCDDQVVKRSGDQVTYAQALIAVQKLSRTHQNHLAMNFTGNKSQFTHRIHRLFGQSPKNRIAPGLGGLGILTFCLMLFTFAPFQQDLQAQNQPTKVEGKTQSAEIEQPAASQVLNIFAQAAEPYTLTVSSENIEVVVNLREAPESNFPSLQQELKDLGVDFELGKSLSEPGWYFMEITYKGKHSKTVFRNAGLIDLHIVRNPVNGKTSVRFSLGPIPEDQREPGQEKGVELRIIGFPNPKTDVLLDTDAVYDFIEEEEIISIEKKELPVVQGFHADSIVFIEEVELPVVQGFLTDSIAVIEEAELPATVIKVEDIPREIVQGKIKESNNNITLQFEKVGVTILDEKGNEKTNTFIMGPSMDIEVTSEEKTPKVLLIQADKEEFISWERFQLLNSTIPTDDIEAITLLTGKVAAKRYGDEKTVFIIELKKGITFPSQAEMGLPTKQKGKEFASKNARLGKIGGVPANSQISNFTIYPNPSNGTLFYNFEVRNAGEVEVNILNLKGQQVSQVYDGYVEATHHKFQWVDKENKLANGIYLLQIKMGDAINTKKFIVEK